MSNCESILSTAPTMLVRIEDARRDLDGPTATRRRAGPGPGSLRAGATKASVARVSLDARRRAGDRGVTEWSSSKRAALRARRGPTPAGSPSRLALASVWRNGAWSAATIMGRAAFVAEHCGKHARPIVRADAVACSGE